MTHYLKLHHKDEHFVDNVRLAGDWGQPGSFSITLKDVAGHEVTLGSLHHIRVLQYTAARTILRYRFWKGERKTVDMRQVISVAWRPDLRRSND